MYWFHSNMSVQPEKKKQMLAAAASVSQAEPGLPQCLLHFPAYLPLPLPFLGPLIVWGICTLSSLLSSSVVNTCLYPYPAWNWVKRKAVPMISLFSRAEHLPALVLESTQFVCCLVLRQHSSVIRTWQGPSFPYMTVSSSWLEGGH